MARAELRSALASSPDMNHAGTVPQASALTAETANAKATISRFKPVSFIRGKFAGPQICQAVNPIAGQSNTRCAADDGDNHRFAEQVANQATARGAQRQSDRELSLATSGTAQEQICEIAAADRQQDADGGEQRPQNAPVVPHDLGVQGIKADAGLARVLIRVLGLQPARDGVEVCLRPSS